MSVEIGKWNLWFASTSIMVIIELIKIVPINTPPSSSIKCSSLIFKRIKVLGCERHKLFEVGIGLGTRSRCRQQCRDKRLEFPSNIGYLHKYFYTYSSNTHLRYSRTRGKSFAPVGKRGPSILARLSQSKPSNQGCLTT